MRRSALESIGDVVADTVTEDLHTSLRLHQQGWHTVFHAGTVARGVAPETYQAFIIQRVRWAKGAMQVIRREWHRRGLSLVQRLSYIASTTTYFDAHRKLILLLTIPAILVTDQLPIHSEAVFFLAIWALQAVVTAYGTKALGRGQHNLLHTEIFDLMKLFAFVRASLTLIHGRGTAFRVTPKGSTPDDGPAGFITPIGLLGALYIVALVIGGMRLSGLGLATANAAATWAAIVWGTAVLARLAFVGWQVWRHLTKRRTFRLAVRLPATLRATDSETWATVTDLTMLSAAIDTAIAPTVGDQVRLEIDRLSVAIEGRVRGCDRSPSGTWSTRIEFDERWHSYPQLATLVASCAAEPGTTPQPRATIAA